MHRTVAFYIHLLVSGLHHHFSVQSHYSPLAGVFLVSAIIAHRRQNLPVFGRHNDTFPQFQAPFHPHPERQCIPDLFQPFQPFLFLFLQLFPLSYPGTPPGFFLQTFHHRMEIFLARPGSVTGYIPLFLPFLHMIIIPVPVHHHDAPVRQTATAPIHFLLIPCQHTGENIKQGSPDRIHQLAVLRNTVIRYLQIKVIKVDAVLIHPSHGDIRFSGTAEKERSHLQQLHTAVWQFHTAE